MYLSWIIAKAKGKHSYLCLAQNKCSWNVNFYYIQVTQKIYDLVGHSIPTSYTLLVPLYLNIAWTYPQRTKGFPMTQQVEKSPVIKETPEIWVQSLGWEDLLNVQLASHPSILIWKMPMVRGVWQAKVHGLRRVGHS